MLEQITQVLQQPDILGERCVHSQLETATCNACVTVCPHQAWILDDDGLGLDTEACHGCALCSAVCPEAALQSAAVEPLAREYKGETWGLAACERATEPPPAGGRIPCLHALGIRQLLKLYSKGVAGLLTARGDCAQCERCPPESLRLETRLADINRALRARKVDGLELKDLPYAKWQKQLDTGKPAVARPALSRRGFLRSGLQQVVESRLPTETETLAAPPARLLPDIPGPWPWLPAIDAERCDGCNACVQICPHGGLTLETEPPAYCIYPRDCSGCGLCRDVCAHQAITLHAWSAPQQTTVPLRRAQCRYCGVVHYRPANQEETLCHVCAKTNHYSKLYQVMK